MSEFLIDNFEAHEVSTVRELMCCASGGPRASKFRRMVMLILRAHYSNAANYGEDFSNLGCYVYSDTPASTFEVGFTDLNDDDVPDNLPGAYVNGGAVTFEKLGMGNQSGMSYDMARQDITKESCLTLQVFHVAKEAPDAYDLAEMSSAVLTALGSEYARRAGASGFEVEGWDGKKKELASPKRHYAVAMSVKIYYNPTVARHTESHRITRLAMLVDPQ